MTDNEPIKANEIIKALECCSEQCENSHYRLTFQGEPFQVLLGNTINLINRQEVEIERLQELVDEMGDYFPACINCEGKTTIGERTDACVYLIDTTNYCTKRGMRNIVAIQNENRELKAEIKTAKAEAVKELANEILSPFEDQVYLSKRDLEIVVKNLAKYY